MKVNRFSFLLLGVAAFACHPQPDNLQLYDQLVVETNYDKSADFGSYSTYAIAEDTLGLVSNTNPNDTLLTGSESDFPGPVTDAIAKAMDERNYTRVGRRENPDIAIQAIVVNDYNVIQQVVYPSGYYSGYYGYNSWYYYPYVQTYTYQNAVLVIQFVDLKNRTPDNKVRVIWTAYLGDLYHSLKLIQQTEAGIQQAFVQSPYITK